MDQYTKCSSKELAEAMITLAIQCNSYVGQIWVDNEYWAEDCGL